MNCILCNSPSTKKIMKTFDMHGRHINNEIEKFFLFECINCECVFLSDILIDQNYYSKYYKKGYYEKIPNGIIGKILNKLFIFSVKRKEKIIAKYQKSKEKIDILDVGCGNGNFLINLNSEKFKLHGLEINNEGRNASIKKGIKVYKEFKNIQNDKKFDVVTMWHVLEHIEKPQEFMKSIRNLLRDNGILVFQIPNTNSFGFKFGRKYWFHLDSPRHLNLNNQKSIKMLCKLTKFKIIEIKNEFYDYPLDLYWSVRRSPIKFIIYPLYPFFKFFSKEHLTFVCKKVFI